jgi:hypothetical protein
MSFLRHREIYPCDEGTISRPCPRSSPWMSLQLVIPGRLLSRRARFRFTSRSYTANHQPRPIMLRQRTAKCSLTDCLSRGVHSTRWCECLSGCYGHFRSPWPGPKPLQPLQAGSRTYGPGSKNR